MFQLFGGITPGLLEWRVGRLLARLFWSGMGFVTESRFHDPVYKKNLHRLVERNHAFKDARKSKG
jgi:hypothetical protein